MGLSRRMRAKPVSREVLDRHNRHRQETFPEIPRNVRERMRREGMERKEDEEGEDVGAAA